MENSLLTKEEMLSNLSLNAQYAIYTGIDDYFLSNQQEEHNSSHNMGFSRELRIRSRRISSVRNITAGILLMLKYHLLNTSDDTKNLILQNNNQSQKIWKEHQKIGSTDHTINAIAIIKHLKKTNQLTDELESNLNEIRETRNALEHTFSSLSNDGLLALLHKAKEVLLDISEKILKLPFNQWITQDQLNKIEKELLSIEKRKSNLLAEFEKCSFYSKDLERHLKSAHCVYCFSSLVKPIQSDHDEKIILQCQSCHEKTDISDIILDKYYSEKEAREGQPCPVGICPSCDEQTLIYETPLSYICQNCGDTFNSVCSVCGNNIDVNAIYENQDIEVCSDCEDAYCKAPE